MKYYLATFTGRLNLALGITYRIKAKTKGTSRDEAILELYPKYERVDLIYLEEVTQEIYEGFNDHETPNTK